MQLDGPFGWCGVCHSKEPGQAGYCPHHDETSIDNDQVSFVKTVQICSKLSNFELRSLLVGLSLHFNTVNSWFFNQNLIFLKKVKEKKNLLWKKSKFLLDNYQLNNVASTIYSFVMAIKATFERLMDLLDIII